VKVRDKVNALSRQVEVLEGCQDLFLAVLHLGAVVLPHPDGLSEDEVQTCDDYHRLITCTEINRAVQGAGYNSVLHTQLL